MESVFLVGFMGSGKSTIGRLLAQRLGVPFVDLDVEIERVDGRTIAEIFETSGEGCFRELESRVLREVASRPASVVALGGGAYAALENRRVIETAGTPVYLETALESILDRVPADGTRPLFESEESVRALYDARLPAYRMAPIRVRTDGLGPDAIAERILQELQR